MLPGSDLPQAELLAERARAGLERSTVRLRFPRTDRSLQLRTQGQPAQAQPYLDYEEFRGPTRQKKQPHPARNRSVPDRQRAESLVPRIQRDTYWLHAAAFNHLSTIKACMRLWSHSLRRKRAAKVAKNLGNFLDDWSWREALGRKGQHWLRSQ